MQVDFYHLTRQPIERVLPRIAERVVEGGGRLLVVSADDRQRATIDTALWNPPESFLPHAQAGKGDDRLQTVLIAAEPVAGNGARHIVLADGVWRDAALDFDRAFHFFDDERIAEARLAWKNLAGRDTIDRRYWKQGESGWEQAG